MVEDDHEELLLGWLLRSAYEVSTSYGLNSRINPLTTLDKPLRPVLAQSDYITLKDIASV